MFDISSGLKHKIEEKSNTNNLNGNDNECTNLI